MTQNKGKPLFGKRPGAVRPPGAVEKMRPSDKRRDERNTAFKNAKVILADRSEVNCIVRDYSASGCLVTLIGAENLPDMISIRLDLLSRPRLARVAWRDHGAVGLEFVDPPETEPMPLVRRTEAKTE